MLDLDEALERALAINAGSFRPQGGIKDDGDALDFRGCGPQSGAIKGEDVGPQVDGQEFSSSSGEGEVGEFGAWSADDAEERAILCGHLSARSAFHRPACACSRFLPRSQPFICVYLRPLRTDVIFPPSPLAHPQTRSLSNGREYRLMTSGHMKSLGHTSPATLPARSSAHDRTVADMKKIRRCSEEHD